MAKKKWIAVTKLGAATRQVDAAIRLWFADDDPVSTHTLLYAAVDVIHGLHGRATGKRLFFQNDAMQSIPGMVQIVKAWPNFFKHGRAYELDRVLQFNPEANLVLFSACIAGLDAIKAPPSDLRDGIAYWMLIHNPDFFPASELIKRPRGVHLRDVRKVRKADFMDAFLRGRRKQRRRQDVSRSPEA